jgi:hypothetical protein
VLDAAAAARRSSSRCTTPTATGTPTSSTPTRRAGPAPTSRCTSRRSTAPTALRARRAAPGDRLHVAVTLHSDDGAVFSASLDGRAAGPLAPLARRPARCAGPAHPCHGIWLWARDSGPPATRPPRQEGVE